MRLAPILIALLLAACGTSAPAPSSTPSVLTSSLPSGSATPHPAPPTADICHVDGATLCVLNPAVSQDTIGSTICRSGWTKTIRPPVAYTDALKRAQVAQFASLHPNDPNWTMASTEEDHRLPLELGGAPRDEHNLSPQERPGADQKDADERTVRQHVCAGRLSLLAAQQAFIAKWLAPWPTYKEVQA